MMIITQADCLEMKLLDGALCSLLTPIKELSITERMQPDIFSQRADSKAFMLCRCVCVHACVYPALISESLLRRAELNGAY